MKKLLPLFSLMFLFGVVGCGEPAGEVGDANDPAESTDDAQMQDETGDIEEN